MSSITFATKEIGFHLESDKKRRDSLTKLQTKGKAGGSCIDENSTRIVELWNKGHQKNLKMMWFQIKVSKSLRQEMKSKIKIINHFMIYSIKLNKLIDVSNGIQKMIDFDVWKSHNKIIISKELTYDNMIYNWLRNGKKHSEADVTMAWCNQVIDPTTCSSRRKHYTNTFQ